MGNPVNSRHVLTTTIRIPSPPEKCSVFNEFNHSFCSCPVFWDKLHTTHLASSKWGYTMCCAHFCGKHINVERTMHCVVGFVPFAGVNIHGWYPIHSLGNRFHGWIFGFPHFVVYINIIVVWDTRAACSLFFSRHQNGVWDCRLAIVGGLMCLWLVVFHSSPKKHHHSHYKRKWTTKQTQIKKKTTHVIYCIVIYSSNKCR